MVLSLDEIKKKLQKPKKKQTISKAIKHEARLRFHTETYMEPHEISQPLTDFLEWVQELIPKDKFKTFVSLFKFPSPTIELTETIYNELERVFDGKNPVVSYQFTDTFFKDDWDEYRKEHLEEPEIWRKKGWEQVKTAINSVLIVDLPEEQTGDYPEPYFYWLDIKYVIDYKLHKEELEYIIFRQPHNRVAVFDTERTWLLQLNDRNEVVEVLKEVEHGLGYTPARFFWTTSLTQACPDIKKSPLSGQLSNLDWLLFFSLSKRHLDLYAPYPIYSAYAADCDFMNNETGEYCDGGFLRDENNQYKVMRDGTVMACPVCAEKKLVGVGSFVEVPVPKSQQDVDLRDPISITTIDSASLEYNTKEVARIKHEIFTGVVGKGGDMTTRESVNELQVKSNFETRTSVLNALKDELEGARQWVDDTVCKLRYGDYYLGSDISMGTEFYIYSVEELYNNYKIAKENGASEAELDNISMQIISTEYRNNPLQMQRAFILKQLEPYRHYTFNDLMSLQQNGLVDKTLLLIKLNFTTFVDRFERENTNIIEFGSQLEFATKIKIITDKFIDYVNEQKTEVGES